MMDVGKFIQELLTLFYAVPPAKLAIADIDAVPNFISTAVPYFFFLIAVECLVAYARGYKAYYLKDTLMSVSLGVVQQVFGMSIKALGIVPYIYVFTHYRLFNIPVDSMLCYFGLLLGCDFFYYWFHRYAHVFHFMWAAHFVHHSGQHYNLATALRQGSLQAASSWAFYLPLALLGFPPAAFAAHSQLNTLTQFWIHTEMIGKLGCLEWVLNTPSHHRMHHRPPGNCNYAAIFIIWDRMFGTFRVEDKQRAYYGLARPLTNFDPVDANQEHWVRMQNIRTKSKAGTVSDILQRLFAKRTVHAMVLDLSVFFTGKDFRNTIADKPGASAWTLPEPATEACTKTELSTAEDKYTVYAGKPLSLGAAVYITVHFILTVVFALTLMDNQAKLEFRQTLSCALYVLMSLSILGRMCDGEMILFELLRICFSAFMVITWTDRNPFFGSLSTDARWMVAVGLVLGWMVCLDAEFYPAVAATERKKEEKEQEENAATKIATSVVATPVVETVPSTPAAVSRSRSPRKRSATPKRVDIDSSPVIAAPNRTSNRRKSISDINKK